MAGAPGDQLRTWYGSGTRPSIKTLLKSMRCRSSFSCPRVKSPAHVVFYSIVGSSLFRSLCHAIKLLLCTRGVLFGLRFEAGWMQWCSCVLLVILCAHPLLEHTNDPLFLNSAALEDTLDIDRTTHFNNTILRAHSSLEHTKFGFPSFSSSLRVQCLSFASLPSPQLSGHVPVFLQIWHSLTQTFFSHVSYSVPLASIGDLVSPRSQVVVRSASGTSR